MAAGGTLSSPELITEGLRFVSENRRDFLRAAAVPVAAMAACAMIGGEFGDGPWAGIALDLVSSAFLAVLAVKWHRFYLLGREAAEPGWAISFGPREIHFFLYLAAYTLVAAMLHYALAEWFDSLGMVWGIGLAILVVIAASFVVCRLILVLPAAALGASNGLLGDLSGSWRSMEGVTLAFFSAMFLLGLAIMAVLSVVIGVGATLPLPGGLAVPVLVLAVIVPGIIAEGVGITMISIAFDRRTPWRDGALAEPSR